MSGEEIGTGIGIVVTAIMSIAAIVKGFKASMDTKAITKAREETAVARDQEKKELESKFIKLETEFNNFKENSKNDRDEAREEQKALAEEVKDQGNRLGRIEERLKTIEDIPNKIDDLNKTVQNMEKDRIRDITKLEEKFSSNFIRVGDQLNEQRSDMNGTLKNILDEIKDLKRQ